jgi:hypothetical protein
MGNGILALPGNRGEFLAIKSNIRIFKPIKYHSNVLFWTLDSMSNFYTFIKILYYQSRKNKRIQIEKKPKSIQFYANVFAQSQLLRRKLTTFEFEI